MKLLNNIKQINCKRVIKYVILILMGAGILNFTKITLMVNGKDYSLVLQILLSIGISVWMLEESK